MRTLGAIGAVSLTLAFAWPTDQGACTAPSAATPVTPIGSFSNLHTTAEHAYGERLMLWRAGGCIIGLLTVTQGPAVDMPLGELIDVRHNPATGELSFGALLSLGVAGGRGSATPVRTKDIFTFTGSLGTTRVVGGLSHADGLSPAARPERRTVMLTADPDAAAMSGVSTYGEWRAKWDPILKARGSEWSAPGTYSQVGLGIYGYVRRVVLEPNDEAPQRIQIWGSFCVSLPARPGQYRPPAQGYLYFELPAAGSEAAIGEWKELKLLGDTGGPWAGARGQPIKYGVAGFGAEGLTGRVRTLDEKPDRPDPYRGGRGVHKVSYSLESPAVKMLGRMLAAVTHANYGLVERFNWEPNADQPQRVVIWGTFVMGQEAYRYRQPQRGVLYFSLPVRPDLHAAVIEQWWAWYRVTGKRQPMFFLSDGVAGRELQLQPWTDKPETPVVYSITAYPDFTEFDLLYTPIRALFPR